MTTDVVEGSKEPKEETQEQTMSTGSKEDAVVDEEKQAVMTDVVEGSKEPKEETQEQAMSTVDKEDAVVGQEKQAVNESE